MPADQSSEKAVTIAPDVEQNLETMSGKVLPRMTYKIRTLFTYSFNFDQNHDNK